MQAKITYQPRSLRSQRAAPRVIPGRSLVLYRFGVAIGLAIALSAPAHAEIALTFGVYTSDKPTAMVQQIRPTLNVLEKRMSTILGEPVSIRMRVARNYKVGLALITSGQVDFARLGAASYIAAKQAAPGITLLAAERYHGTHFFKGIICVKTNSPITRVVELKGKTFAFGSKSSTIGRYLAQLYLSRAGINASNLRAYAYLGRHDRVGEAVGSGQFDAGALEETIFKKLVASGVPIRPIASFPNVTKAWVARTGLDPHIIRALHQGLLAVKDPAALTALRFGGFINVDDADYAMVRTAIKENATFSQAGRLIPASR